VKMSLKTFESSRVAGIRYSVGSTFLGVILRCPRVSVGLEGWRQTGAVALRGPRYARPPQGDGVREV
jgi:hypothetical protein